MLEGENIVSAARKAIVRHDFSAMDQEEVMGRRARHERREGENDKANVPEC